MTLRGHNGVNPSFEVLHSASAFFPLIVRHLENLALHCYTVADNDKVHHDYDLDGVEPRGIIHRRLTSCVPSFVPILKYRWLGPA